MAYFLAEHRCHHELVEMTASELRAAEANPAPGVVRYKPLSWQLAHQWVREGGLHMTALWVDEGRIRRAGE